jgi:hypothetical protein
MSTSNIYHQAMLFQKFLDTHPTASKYQNQDIALVKRKLSDKLFSEHLMHQLKNNVECRRPLTYDNEYISNTQLYSFVYFYPPFKFYHDLKGFDGIDLYGKELTEELLEVWYTYSLQYTLNSLVIDVEYNDFSSPITAEYLVEHLNTMLFRHINGRFPDNKFKSLTYKASILHVMKIAYLSNKYDYKYDLACLELIRNAIKECPDLSFESFGLDQFTFNQVKNGSLKGKNAFDYSIKYKLIDEEMLSKYEMLLPDHYYSKVITQKFLTHGSKFADMIEPKGSLKHYKNAFLRFLANIGNNEKTS